MKILARYYVGPIEALRVFVDELPRPLSLSTDSNSKPELPSVLEREESGRGTYNAERDLAGSISEGFAAIRARKINGGKGWDPK